MLWLYIALALAMLACALQAMRAKRLMYSALWLACSSALVSILFFMMGAYAVAVIELSVGAGLVTVLFVFAISIAGEETIEARSIVPKPIAWALVLISIVLLGFMTVSSLITLPSTAELSFSDVLWQQRGLDMLVQSGLLFAAVVGMLGLLAEAKVPAKEKQSVKVAQPQVNQPATTQAAAVTHAPREVKV